MTPPDEPPVPPALRAAYHDRCQVEGASLETFVAEVRDAHADADLVALVDAVEAEILENIELMAAARPDLEPVAGERVEAVRARMRHLRETLGERR